MQVVERKKYARREPADLETQYDILTRKQYLYAKDIGLIFGWGETKVSKEIKSLHEYIISKGKLPIKGAVSRDVFVEYYGINLNQMAKNLKNLKEMK